MGKILKSLILCAFIAANSCAAELPDINPYSESGQILTRADPTPEQYEADKAYLNSLALDAVSAISVTSSPAVTFTIFQTI